MKLTIKDFEEGAEIPKKFTCDSEDYSPELSWSGVPTGTKSLAIIVDDPDAPVGNFVHWVIYNIPIEINNLAENYPRVSRMSNGIMQGKNDFGRIGYNGPCPPRGHGFHRYYFTLYATEVNTITKEGLTKNELMKIIEGKIISKDTRMGRYKR